MISPKNIVAWWRHVATLIWVQIGSGNGMLLDKSTTLAKSIIRSHQNTFWGIHMKANVYEVLMNLMLNVCLDIKLLKFIPFRVNESKIDYV